MATVDIGWLLQKKGSSFHVNMVENSKIQSYHYVIIFYSQEMKAVQMQQVSCSLLTSSLLSFFRIPLRLKNILKNERKGEDGKGCCVMVIGTLCFTSLQEAQQRSGTVWGFINSGNIGTGLWGALLGYFQKIFLQVHSY